MFDITGLPATSLLGDRALLAAKAVAGGVPAMLTVTARAGTPCLYLDAFVDTNEAEVLFPLGSRWRLDAWTVRPDGILQLALSA